MMVENDTLCKENTLPNNVPNSDDSYSGFSFPWFPTQTKRKSRLGMRQRDRVRVLQDIAPNVSSELTPLTSTQDSKTESVSQPLDVRSVSPMSTSVPTFESASQISSKFDYFEPPSALAQSTSFDAFEPPAAFNEFKLPSLSPHSTPMDIFDSICSLSSPPATTKTSFESIGVSPPSSSTKSSFESMCVSPPSIRAKTSFESMCVSPPSAETKTSSQSICISPPPPAPARISFESVRSVSPVKLVPNVLQPSNTYNTALKSSLRKPLSPLTGNEEPPAKPTTPRKEVRFNEEPPAKPTTPRKEVRFAEPAPLPSTTSLKPTKDLPAHITVKNKTYRVKGKLGTGGSCIVYEVSDPETEDTLAIKRVKLPEDEDYEYVAEGYLQEVKMLEKLQSSSDVIIKMFDYQLVYENGCRVLYVVLEKGEMDLSKFMRGVGKTDKLHYIIFYWRLMLLAVNKIHDEDIIHMDLKPANFLLVKGRLKLIDFGIASSMPEDKTSIYLEATSGTLSYTSPETLSVTNPPINSSGNRMNELKMPSGYRISKKSDVWSLGCILYQWIYGHAPFHTSMNKWQRLLDIINPEKEVEFPERKNVPESLLRSLQSCLQKDPKKRPTVKELLQLKLEISLDQCMS